MNKRKVTGTLEVCLGFQVVERTIGLLKYPLICWLEMSATGMHPGKKKKKARKGVLRSGATVNEICLVFPPKNVALGHASLSLCACGGLPLQQWAQLGYTGSLHRGCCALAAVPCHILGDWALSAQGWLKDFSVGMGESWDARLQMGRSV